MARGDVGFAAASAFLLGVAAASFDWSLYGTLGAGVLAVALYAIVVRSTNVQLAFFLLPLLVGFFYFHFYLNIREERERIPIGTTVVFEGVVSEEPKFSESVQMLRVRLAPPHAGTIRMLTSPVPEYRYGDRVRAEGKVLPRANPGDTPLAMFPRITLVERGGAGITSALLDFKERLVRPFRTFLSRDAGALMAGLTFGSQADFSKDFKAAMSASGTTHVVALSGYNVAIITVALSGFLRRFLRRRRAFLATVGVLILFILMVGGETSVVRAAIMGFLLLLAREIGRGYHVRNAIFFAAVLMALHTPTVLRWDIGFQLSFVSLLGIVYLAPALSRFLKTGEGGWIGFFGEELRITLSAQLAVLPILVTSFGSFSPTSIAANVALLPFVPLTMFLGFVMAGVGLFVPFLAVVVGWGAHILLSYEVFVIRVGANFALPVSWAFSTVLTIVYAAALIAFVAWGWRQQQT